MAHGAGVKVECYDDRFDCNSRPVPEQRALRVYLVCSNPAAEKRCKNRLKRELRSALCRKFIFPRFCGGNYTYNSHCPKDEFMKVTPELLEEGISLNGAWSKKQLLALGVPIRKEFKLIKGWKGRLIGSETTEQQKKQFLALKNAHIKDDEPLFESLEQQHMKEICACL